MSYGGLIRELAVIDAAVDVSIDAVMDDEIERGICRLEPPFYYM